MYCNKCGKDSINEGRFCPHCGAPYEMSGSAVPPNPQARQYSSATYNSQPYDNTYQTAYEQPVQAQPQFEYGAMSYTEPKKNPNSLLVPLVIAVIIVAVFGAFIIMEATGVTEVTGWFGSDTTKEEVVSDNDEKVVLDDTEDSDEDEEFDETIANEPKTKHKYDKYSETRESDDDEKSEFSFSEDTYVSSSASSDADKVADYVETLKDSYEESSTNEAGTGYMEARGTSIVCGFKYTTDVPSNAKELLAETLDTDAASSTFEELCEMAKDEEPAVSSVFVEYYDKNGELLYSKEYR